MEFYILLISVIIFFVALGQFTMTLYLPALPVLAEYFNASDASVQFSLIIFLISFALSQFFYGVLSDRYGRKRLLMLGIFISIIGTSLIIFSKNIFFFNCARCIQGLGAGAIASLSRAIIRDKHAGSELDIFMSYVVMAVAITPILSPLLGGFIQQYLGWKAIFEILLIYAAIVEVVIFRFLPETNDLRGVNKTKSSYWHSYKSIFSNRVYLIFVACIIIGYSCQLLYMLVSPFIFQKSLHMSVDRYGEIMMFPATAYFVGNIIYNRLLKHMQANFLMMIASFIITGSGIYMYFFLNIHSDSVVKLVSLIVMVIFGVSFIYSNAISSCLKPFNQAAGIASSMSVFLQMLGSGVVVKIFNWFHVNSINALGVAFAILGFSALLLTASYVFISKKNFKMILTQK